MATARTRHLQGVAERIVAALPPLVEEVVLTGSVSRGVADDLSDIEMLVVTTEPLDLAECFEHARRVGLDGLDTWGPQGTEVSRVFGYFETVPVELVWWPRDYAEESVAALLAGEPAASAEALANGVALRTAGLLGGVAGAPSRVPGSARSGANRGGGSDVGWLSSHGIPDPYAPGRAARARGTASRRCRACSPDRLRREPGLAADERLADRVRVLPVRPERLAERIEGALTEPDPFQALLVMTGLQVDTVALAPSGPNIDRARRWLPDVIEALRR